MAKLAPGVAFVGKLAAVVIMKDHLWWINVQNCTFLVVDLSEVCLWAGFGKEELLSLSITFTFFESAARWYNRQAFERENIFCKIIFQHHQSRNNKDATLYSYWKQICHTAKSSLSKFICFGSFEQIYLLWHLWAFFTVTTTLAAGQGWVNYWASVEFSALQLVLARLLQLKIWKSILQCTDEMCCTAMYWIHCTKYAQCSRKKYCMHLEEILHALGRNTACTLHPLGKLQIEICATHPP